MPNKTRAELEALADKIMSTSTVGKLTMAIMMLQTGITDERTEHVIRAALEDLQSTRLLGITRAPVTTAARK